MTREELIKQCRYYTGAEKNPFEIEGGTKALLFGYEEAWVRFTQSDKEYINSCLDEYIKNGLKDFKSDDNIPITLKAILFNRFCHWNGYGDVVSDFKEWYNKYY